MCQFYETLHDNTILWPVWTVLRVEISTPLRHLRENLQDANKNVQVVRQLWKQKAEKTFTAMWFYWERKKARGRGDALRNFMDEIRRVAGYSD